MRICRRAHVDDVQPRGGGWWFGGILVFLVLALGNVVVKMGRVCSCPVDEPVIEPAKWYEG